ncbi:phosphonoacetaldehyde hydrolase [Brevundimonas sp. SORGH_AS_0993]|uniref:phosphonoacetaldehyde hydrolase n=1 Tax=Brevundimonas sp. SORGH_AS_0993 TaxID=3041794 RepID=UPI00277DE43B|nr:phosphonoacetaldehyde hydrolase [Brevundimonas sp. SORGH_AS_0993]MDQ1154372.1 phosphonoacetaldehyde hydrolase [Brevundimonas sp. SORGH_AS_0993]
MTSLRDRFDMVVFDWAGTMVDFGSRAPVLALMEAFAILGVPVTEDEARRDMGRAKADHVCALFEQPRVSDAWRTAHGATPDFGAVERVMTELQTPMIRMARETADLIPGGVDVVARLRQEGLKIASCTGYTREMMQAILPRAADQGYAPDLVVCAHETAQGRPSPLMIYKACADLGVWPLSRVVKVDDAEVGVAEGRNAGCFTVGVAASGNLTGLTAQGLAELDSDERAARLAAAAGRLRESGADLVIDTVADLIPALEAETARLTA